MCPVCGRRRHSRAWVRARRVRRGPRRRRRHIGQLVGTLCRPSLMLPLLSRLSLPSLAIPYVLFPKACSKNAISCKSASKGSGTRAETRASTAFSARSGVAGRLSVARPGFQLRISSFSLTVALPVKLLLCIRRRPRCRGGGTGAITRRRAEAPEWVASRLLRRLRGVDWRILGLRLCLRGFGVRTCGRSIARDR